MARLTPEVDATAAVPATAPRAGAVRVALSVATAQLDLPALVVEPGPPPLVDGRPLRGDLRRWDRHRAVLTTRGRHGGRHDVLLMPPEPRARVPGVVEREVVVDGWRFVVEVESERRAGLRERARRGLEESVGTGPTEIRAVIPGRLLSIAVATGDVVSAGQQLLVVEAMKMQNEVRASRAGTVGQVAVAPGQTIELGNLLLVIE